jgi:hypothetical protein
LRTLVAPSFPPVLVPKTSASGSLDSRRAACASSSSRSRGSGGTVRAAAAVFVPGTFSRPPARSRCRSAMTALRQCGGRRGGRVRRRLRRVRGRRRLDEAANRLPRIAAPLGRRLAGRSGWTAVVGCETIGRPRRALRVPLNVMSREPDDDQRELLRLRAEVAERERGVRDTHEREQRHADALIARLRLAAHGREDHLADLRERLEAAERELVDLRAIRDALTPPEIPERPGVELAAALLPAAERVSGDFYSWRKDQRTPPSSSSATSWDTAWRQPGERPSHGPRLPRRLRSPTTRVSCSIGRTSRLSNAPATHSTTSPPRASPSSRESGVCGGPTRAIRRHYRSTTRASCPRRGRERPLGSGRSQVMRRPRVNSRPPLGCSFIPTG